MNIAIFNHPFTDFYSSPKRMYKNILNYLKDIIINDSQDKHNVECFDVVKSLKKEISLPEGLSYLEEYLDGGVADYLFFKKYYQFGSIDNFNHKHFKNFNPDLIIITSFAYCYFDGFKSIVNYLKGLCSVPVICGGHGPSSNPEYYLKNSNADYVVTGPAELTLNILIEKMAAGVECRLENVFYNNYYGKINLDKPYQYMPYIDVKGKKNVAVQLTRGCPKSCNYCSVPIISGKYYRKVDIRVFENHIKKLDLTGKVHFDFEDDNLSHDKKYLFDALDMIKKYFPDSTISFENGIDFMTLTFKMIDKLVKYGITQWNLSLTSINSKILSNSGRNYVKDDFDKIIDYIRQYKLPVIVYFICGMPDDEEENIFETLMYLIEKKVLIGISTFYSVPNTLVVKKIDREILPVLSKGSSFYQWGKISTKKLITFFILTRFINIMRKNNDVEYGKKDNSAKKVFEYSIERKKLYYIDDKNNLMVYNIDEELASKFFDALQSRVKK